jgi:hypothetical protein
MFFPPLDGGMVRLRMGGRKSRAVVTGASCLWRLCNFLDLFPLPYVCSPNSQFFSQLPQLIIRGTWSGILIDLRMAGDVAWQMLVQHPFLSLALVITVPALIVARILDVLA